MLVDHGVDCTTSFLSNIFMQRIVSYESGALCYLIMCISTSGFYFGTLEHHYAGELVLDNPNAVTDGAIAYAMLCFAVAYFGNDFVNTEINLG